MALPIWLTMSHYTPVKFNFNMLRSDNIYSAYVNLEPCLKQLKHSLVHHFIYFENPCMPIQPCRQQFPGIFKWYWIVTQRKSCVDIACWAISFTGYQDWIRQVACATNPSFLPTKPMVSVVVALMEISFTEIDRMPAITSCICAT
jgi:hypothetical protein